MTDKDWNYIALLEKAFKKKYGNEAVVNPKNSWTDEKEEEYLKELKEFYKQQETLRKLFETRDMLEQKLASKLARRRQKKVRRPDQPNKVCLYS